MAATAFGGVPLGREVVEGVRLATAFSGVPPMAEKAYNRIMYYVYVLRSLAKQRYYVGHTANTEERLANHNRGQVRSTKAYKPWEIVYTESYATKQDAYAREMKIKSYKSGKAFKSLINI